MKKKESKLILNKNEASRFADKSVIFFVLVIFAIVLFSCIGFVSAANSCTGNDVSTCPKAYTEKGCLSGKLVEYTYFYKCVNNVCKKTYTPGTPAACPSDKPNCYDGQCVQCSSSDQCGEHMLIGHSCEEQPDLHMLLNVYREVTCKNFKCGTQIDIRNEGIFCPDGQHCKHTKELAESEIFDGQCVPNIPNQETPTSTDSSCQKCTQQICRRSDGSVEKKILTFDTSDCDPCADACKTPGQACCDCMTQQTGECYALAGSEDSCSSDSACADFKVSDLDLMFAGIGLSSAGLGSGNIFSGIGELFSGPADDKKNECAGEKDGYPCGKATSLLNYDGVCVKGECKRCNRNELASEKSIDCVSCRLTKSGEVYWTPYGDGGLCGDSIGKSGYEGVCSKGECKLCDKKQLKSGDEDCSVCEVNPKTNIAAWYTKNEGESCGTSDFDNREGVCRKGHCIKCDTKGVAKEDLDCRTCVIDNSGNPVWELARQGRACPLLWRLSNGHSASACKDMKCVSCGAIPADKDRDCITCRMNYNPKSKQIMWFDMREGEECEKFVGNKLQDGKCQEGFCFVEGYPKPVGEPSAKPTPRDMCVPDPCKEAKRNSATGKINCESTADTTAPPAEPGAKPIVNLNIEELRKKLKETPVYGRAAIFYNTFDDLIKGEFPEIYKKYLAPDAKEDAQGLIDAFRAQTEKAIEKEVKKQISNWYGGRARDATAEDVRIVIQKGQEGLRAAIKDAYDPFMEKYGEVFQRSKCEKAAMIDRILKKVNGKK